MNKFHYFFTTFSLPAIGQAPYPHEKMNKKYKMHISVVNSRKQYTLQQKLPFVTFFLRKLYRRKHSQKFLIFVFFFTIFRQLLITFSPAVSYSENFSVILHRCCQCFEGDTFPPFHFFRLVKPLKSVVSKDDQIFSFSVQWLPKIRKTSKN